MVTPPDAGFEKDKGPDGLEILERIGAGRRSNWYRANQVRLDREVALKCLRPILAESPAFQQTFLDAGRQAAAIVHPAALPIINVYPKHHCIAMQWCPGRALADRDPEEIDSIRVAGIGVVVMDCLAALHATGRCHGNLSTGNIFTAPPGKVWVTDFFHPPVVREGEKVFLANQRFIAPEVVSGSEPPDWRCDVFSLGCILHELATTAPGGCGRDFTSLIEIMRTLAPEGRGESPQAILEALKRTKKLEELRKGISTDTMRRRRMYRRVPGEFDVSLRRRSASPGETATILNKIRDIGESGVFVETDDDLIGIGSIIELDFTLKGVDGNVHAFGVVRWRSSPPMPKGVGVQFMEVDQEGLARLRRFLETRQEEEKES